jgi:hypothetical protein
MEEDGGYTTLEVSMDFISFLNNLEAVSIILFCSLSGSEAFGLL